MRRSSARLTALRAAARRFSARLQELLASALAAAVSLANELVVLTAVVLGTIALWQDFGLRALGFPAAVLLWIALPQRPAFITRRSRGDDDVKGNR